MKKIALLFSLIFSQFAFAQFPGEPTIIYLECDGDSIALDITGFQNMPFDFINQMFDCDNQDEWSWDNEGWGDSTDVDNPWEYDEIFEIVSELETACSQGDWEACGALELLNDCSQGNENACFELEELYEIYGEDDEDQEWSWDDSTDVNNPWEDGEIFEIISELEMACGQGDWEACGALELLNDCLEGSESACAELEELYEIYGEDDDDEEWPWDDSLDLNNPWEDEEIFEIISELEMACSQGGWEACGALELLNDCLEGSESACAELEELYEIYSENDDEEWPWDDSTDVDCPWEDGFPGSSNGDGFNNEMFEDMMAIFADVEMAEDDMILILEQTDVLISIISASGLEFTPTLIDGYLVFGPFSIEDLYSILLGEMDGPGIGWGLLRPNGVQIIGEGVITASEQSLNAMFSVSPMLSIEENTAALEVYKTSYFTLLGTEVKTATNGMFIKVMQTNKGTISDKVYIRK
jgi:hypothetical protein